MHETEPLIRIVDDDLDDREAIAYLLNSLGFKTVTYADAVSFLTGDAPSVPGCVVLDVKMPQMSGLELQQEMLERGICLPIIFLTAHGDVEMAVGAVLKGAVNFLLKPVDTGKLKAAIEAALARQQHWTTGGMTPQERRYIYDRFTDRKKEVLRLLALGVENRQIAGRLGISERTVEGHRTQSLHALGVKSVRELGTVFREMGVDV